LFLEGNNQFFTLGWVKLKKNFAWSKPDLGLKGGVYGVTSTNKMRPVATMTGSVGKIARKIKTPKQTSMKQAMLLNCHL
jgi:hypothetical protein